MGAPRDKTEEQTLRCDVWRSFEPNLDMTAAQMHAVKDAVYKICFDKRRELRRKARVPGSAVHC